MNPPLRVALFTDSFQEANGVATLSQEYAEYARRASLPFCCVHSGEATRSISDGSLYTLELKRGPASFSLGNDLLCDPLLNRHRNWVLRQLGPFKPDLIHIMGPGDMGILGFWVAHCLQIPMVASWHTNLHEYLGRRFRNMLSFAPFSLVERSGRLLEKHSLRALLKFYRLAHFVMAPNHGMVELLSKATGRPAYPMAHGVDIARFSPDKRAVTTSGEFCIGYVGRLSPEKNVSAFVELERKLLAAGQRNFRLLLIGEGSQRHWLQRNLRFGELPGVLRGEPLATAFAGMDAFVFPSMTDTYGLVLLEAMASGVPVVVTPETGAQVEVNDRCGALLGNDFAASLIALMNSRKLRDSMGREARHLACSRIWRGVFDSFYQTFDHALGDPQVRARMHPAALARTSGAAQSSARPPIGFTP